MSASELYQAGQLAEAIDAAIEDVKKNPTDVTKRFMLGELLCFAGEFERADSQLDTVSKQSPEATVLVGLFRHLIRAEIARQQFYSEGRLPEFLSEVSPSLRLRLDASIALREGNSAEAHELLEQAEELRPKVRGTCNGNAFDDLRDLDDLTAGFFEVLTSTGKYYWVPVEQVESMEFSTPERMIDLIWRRTSINVENGPEGEVYIPAIYAETAQQSDNQLSLGRGTDWRGGDGLPVRGIGLRMFLVGENDQTIMQLKELAFDRS